MAKQKKQAQKVQNRKATFVVAAIIGTIFALGFGGIVYFIGLIIPIIGWLLNWIGGFLILFSPVIGVMFAKQNDKDLLFSGRVNKASYR